MFGWKGGVKAAEVKATEPGPQMRSGSVDMLGGLGDRLGAAGGGWRRPRARIRVVAVLCSLLAGAVVFGIFGKVRVGQGEARPEKQLIGTIDLRIGNPAVMTERGEAQARLDIEAGLLQLRVFGSVPTKAEAGKAQQLKQRYGFAWLNKGDVATPLSQAYADGYNRVMQAEIEHRHGSELLDRLLREQDAHQQDKTGTP